MQCRRCGFENMPGIKTCMRCHAVMVAAAPIRVHPPRAGWKRIFRPMLYRLNRLNERMPGLLTPLAAPFRWGFRHTAFMHGALWAALSILPGLGHVVSRRARDLRWLWPAWAAALAAGIFFFGTTAGSVLLGLSVALHVWIICDAGRLRDLFTSASGRLVFVMCIYLVLVLYFQSALMPRIQADWIQTARLMSDLGMDDLRRDDFLIFWPRAYIHEPPRRGDVILYKLSSIITDNGREGFMFRGGPTVGKILGMPGEHLRSSSGALTVSAPDGTVTSYRIDPPSALPVEIDLQLPPDRYFCLAAGLKVVQAQGRRNINMKDVYVMAGQVSRSGILGRGVMLYQPFWRRTRLSRQLLPLAPGPTAPAAIPGQGGR